MSYVMALVVFTGFSVALAMGRSSFAAPPIVHAHALVFMGWVVLYVAQNTLVARGSIALHRRLGWIAAGWVVAMVVLGTLVTMRLAQLGRVPPVFPPVQFLVFDPVLVLTFAGLTSAAIALRRSTQWHRRLHYCGMALLLGPALGRLLPLPLLIPYAYEADFLAVLVFPLIGIVADIRRSGTVHPAWWWGLGAIVGSTVLVELITFSPLGAAFYAAVVAGTPGAAVSGYAFPPFPGMP
ncbi:hypothetical protein EAH76_06480 [Sphingomonas glacialis]|uniref:Uncharacterized protein n=2 Tax=Sphingomonas glacialis TaxID=658225 RepID=A0A502G2J9_9SPHN|nr:hypothetical protein EAH76_06480 [Sphingomonas glacialis]